MIKSPISPLMLTLLWKTLYYCITCIKWPDSSAIFSFVSTLQIFTRNDFFDSHCVIVTLSYHGVTLSCVCFQPQIIHCFLPFLSTSCKKTSYCRPIRKKCLLSAEDVTPELHTFQGVTHKHPNTPEPLCKSQGATYTWPPADCNLN